jgi:hypothetical protein
MKCQSERTYISIGGLNALRVLRIVEVRAGLAKLQIILQFSWSVAYEESGSSQ